ncbi:MAG: hypothetical protein GY821_05210 [Gammaproteobacteria bacterium]|nr:hypothetical protein [Gammaproteobacteria bacterium]
MNSRRKKPNPKDYEEAAKLPKGAIAKLQNETPVSDKNSEFIMKQQINVLYVKCRDLEMQLQEEKNNNQSLFQAMVQMTNEANSLRDAGIQKDNIINRQRKIIKKLSISKSMDYAMRNNENENDDGLKDKSNVTIINRSNNVSDINCSSSFLHHSPKQSNLGGTDKTNKKKECYDDDNDISDAMVTKSAFN